MYSIWRERRPTMITVAVLLILPARTSFFRSSSCSAGVSTCPPGTSSGSTPALSARSWSSPLRISSIDFQSYLSTPKMSVKMATRTIGDSKAATLPASIGLLEPVHSTPRLPHSFLAVTSHAVRAQPRPMMGDKDAAHLFWPDLLNFRQTAVKQRNTRPKREKKRGIKGG